jgi:hypothetical protein
MKATDRNTFFYGLTLDGLRAEDAIPSGENELVTRKPLCLQK